MGKKCGKLCISNFSNFRKGQNSYKKWRMLTILKIDLKSIKRKSYTKFQVKVSKHVREKCGKLYFQHSNFRKGQNSYKNKRKLTTLEINFESIKRKLYTKIQANVWKHVGEKCRKLCISCILGPKQAVLLQKLSQIDDNQTWSEVHCMKVIFKISAQYFKAYNRKMGKTVYFKYSKFQKGRY